MIEIVSQLSKSVLYKADCSDVREAVVQAVRDGANLTWANLYGANLTRANLTWANLDDSTRLPTGETWQEYREVILPALCTAAGKTLDEVAAAWDCHEWSNCPMHVAFDFDGDFDTQDVPASVQLLKPRIDQFVQLFDAKLLPCPCELASIVSADEKP